MRPLVGLGPLLALVLASPVVAPTAPAAVRPTVRLVVVDEVGEGDAAVVRVILDAPSGRDVTVSLDTRAGTAFSPRDYRGVHRRVTVPAGETVERLEIATVRDAVAESPEDFSVRLSRPVGAGLGDRRETVTIRNRAPLPRVRVAEATFTEPALGHRLGYTLVSLSAPGRHRIVVELSTRSGTATAGQDFVPLHPSVVFEPGDTSEPVSVELLSDGVVEPAETMRLVVTDVRHATAKRGATMTILDASGG